MHPFRDTLFLLVVCMKGRFVRVPFPARVEGELINCECDRGHLAGHFDAEHGWRGACSEGKSPKPPRTVHSSISNWRALSGRLSREHRQYGQDQSKSATLFTDQHGARWRCMTFLFIICHMKFMGLFKAKRTLGTF